VAGIRLRLTPAQRAELAERTAAMWHSPSWRIRQRLLMVRLAD
jgi:hypothetical protein